MSTVPPEEIAYQKAHASDFNGGGISAFCITGEIVVVLAVALRIYSRRVSRISLQADDFTLIAATILSLTAVILSDVRGEDYSPLAPERNYGRSQEADMNGLQYIGMAWGDIFIRSAWRIK